MEIRFENVHKYFGKVHANKGITFTVKAGTIHGLIGENGAGKSTLMKILAGFISKSSGKIYLDGKEVNFSSPAEATGFGIGMLYQEPCDFPTMTVIENFMVGVSKEWKVDEGKYRKILKEKSEKLGFSIDPDKPVGLLTVGERQQLEIIRLLTLGVKTLILDEPTTGISKKQKETLFNALRQLAKEGKSIILISHKLQDVEVICDRVTVLREGKVAGEMERPFNREKLLEMMFGKKPPEIKDETVVPGETILKFENVYAHGGRAGLKNLNLEIKEKEIIGLAGLEGSGQEVFLRVAAGLIRPYKGKVRKNRKIFRNKLSEKVFLPASRLEEGLFPSLTLLEHYALGFFKNYFIIPWAKAREKGKKLIEKFKIKGSLEDKAASLSGGNQQRLLISLIKKDTKLLLLEQPTRGLDTESSVWMWEHFKEFAKKGSAIVFTSPELDEIFSVATKIVVFFNGRVVLSKPKEETSQEEVAAAIAGNVEGAEVEH
ncbi:ABC transporter ATP-binding protein [Desulfurobacterium atlanticum]|uniref:Nucleoside ABC transporter ATP-binding protein n=1 Tax=Desulfurobacterium atlanticum TaxID=240169 RepID=A0A238XP49_9BACT|nr:ATP-binding cassette domain-containing protein [Desulfurobacterium atlanticum]SNR60480.1 nucleoside ABC transporter ATP-binding protein [Desulfurobacterium atlanticum]